MKNRLKDGLVIAALLSNAAGYAERVRQLGSAPALARGSLARWLWGAALGLSFVSCETYRRSTGHFIDYPMFKVLLESTGGGPDAARQFARPLAVSSIGGILLFLGVGLPPRDPGRARAAAAP